MKCIEGYIGNHLHALECRVGKETEGSGIWFEQRPETGVEVGLERVMVRCRGLSEKSQAKAWVKREQAVSAAAMSEVNKGGGRSGR